MADFSQSTKEQMNDPSNGLVPSKVSRKTVADGSWLQKYTFGKLSARDNFLADQIDGVSGNLASAYDDMVEDISALQGDVVSLSDEIKNMSPLTYRGTGTVDEIKGKTDKRNGDVYSITGLTGSSAKSGIWWIGGTTKQGDDDFKVKNNDEVAYTSATNRWFPIGQDIHVEYSAGENIEITDDNVINISGRVNLNLVAPITGALDGSTYNIGFSPISLTAQHISVIENNTDTTNRPLTWYNSESLYYNTGVYVNGDTFYSQNISSNNITGVATSASKVNVYNWSSNNNRPIAFVGTTTATAAGQYYSDVGIDSNTLYFNPSKDTLYSKNVSAATLTLTGTGNITAAYSTNIPLTIGDPNGQHIVIDGNEIASKTSPNSKNGTLWLNDEMTDGHVYAFNFSANKINSQTATCDNFSGSYINNYNTNSLITNAKNGQSAYNRLSQVASNAYAEGAKTFTNTTNYTVLKDNILSLPAGKSLLFIAAGNLYGNQGQANPAIIDFALTTGTTTATRLQYFEIQCRLHDNMMRTSTYAVPNQVPFTLTFACNNYTNSAQNIKFCARVTTPNGVGTVTANDLRASWIII